MNTLKVFDFNEDFAEDLQDIIEDYLATLEVSNDSYTPYYVADNKDPLDKRFIKLDKWFIENGCDVGEKVLIFCSW